VRSAGRGSSHVLKLPIAAADPGIACIKPWRKSFAIFRTFVLFVCTSAAPTRSLTISQPILFGADEMIQ